MTHAAFPAAESADIALAYHARTKHRPERYAAGPETLDWDAQPNPFREFEGCARIALSLGTSSISTSLADIYAPGSVQPSPLSIASVGVLLELSMGLSAWKEYGPDRWALRCNPSSGNLHPTEAYVVSRAIPGLENGLYHYQSKDHVLEQRCRSGAAPADAEQQPRLWIGLASVHWREAWKYGERAFRYCQLDVGHALGALRYAAGTLGWRARAVENFGSAELAALMGLDRAEEFSGVEHEECDLLIAIDTYPENDQSCEDDRAPGAWDSETTQWAGRANLLDPRPIYHWPVINQVSLATRGTFTGNEAEPPKYPPLLEPPKALAASIILNRRSAQRFNSKYTMSADIFYRMLDCLLVRPVAPWDVWTYSPRLHLIIFIHRVEGVEPGLYALPRHRAGHGCPARRPSAGFPLAKGRRRPRSSSPCQTYARRLPDSRQDGELPSSDRE